jgi:hypothetical protein
MTGCVHSIHQRAIAKSGPPIALSTPDMVMGFCSAAEPLCCSPDLMQKKQQIDKGRQGRDARLPLVH